MSVPSAGRLPGRGALGRRVRLDPPPMTPVLLLSVLLAAPDAGTPSHGTAHSARSSDAGVRAPSAADAGVRAPSAADAGVRRADVHRAAPDGGQASQAVRESPNEPSTRIAVQEPAPPDAGTPKVKKARADRTDGQGDPQTDALLEQSRAQTEALQQIAAQQRATEEARIAEQQARSQRGLQIDGARSSIDGAVQSLQATGDWNASSLRSTRASLEQTAAAASAAGSPVEANRAAEAARLVEAAEAALAQRNAQQAQYYLLQANQLLQGAQSVRY